MKSTTRQAVARSIFAAALSGSLIAGCSGGTPAPVASGPSSAGVTYRSVGPSDSVIADSSSMALPMTEAERISAETLTTSAKALHDTSAKGLAARSASFTREALPAANAFAKLWPTATAAFKADNSLSNDAPGVLAVPHSPSYPRVIIAQTTLAKSNTPVLNLLVQAGADQPYKVAASTTLLPKANVSGFPSSAAGALGVDGANLVASPQDVLRDFTASVKYPSPATAKLLADDPFTSALRQNAKSQATALGNTGVLGQSHTPGVILGGVTLTGDNGTLVFMTAKRVDEIALREATAVTPSVEFQILAKLKQFKTEASFTTDEVIAVVIPKAGKARIVARSEQMIAAYGH